MTRTLGEVWHCQHSLQRHKSATLLPSQSFTSKCLSPKYNRCYAFAKPPSFVWFSIYDRYWTFTQTWKAFKRSVGFQEVCQSNKYMKKKCRDTFIIVSMSSHAKSPLHAVRKSMYQIWQHFLQLKGDNTDFPPKMKGQSSTLFLTPLQWKAQVKPVTMV